MMTTLKSLQPIIVVGGPPSTQIAGMENQCPHGSRSEERQEAFMLSNGFLDEIQVGFRPFNGFFQTIP